MPNRTIVVTGAFGALGRGVAAAAAASGASVAAIDVAPAPPPELAAQLGPRSFCLGGADLSTAEGAAKAMAAIKARLGRIDALVNIAGGFAWERAETGDTLTWERMFKLNLATTLNASRAALPHLLENGAGRIVNVGANAALKAGAGMGAYAASKSAVHRLTESLAEELKDRDVTVNAVLPSTIDTPANRKDMPDADFDKWVKPADLAALILFLVSPDARAVNGALIPVTGRG